MRQYKTISFSVSPSLHKELIKTVKLEGMTISEFIREALREHLHLITIKQNRINFSKKMKRLGLAKEDAFQEMFNKFQSKKKKGKK